MMLISSAEADGSTAHLCLESPKHDRLKRAFEPGRSVHVTLDATCDDMHMRDGHADLNLNVHGISVRPSGRNTISDLIERHQKKAVR